MPPADPAAPPMRGLRVLVAEDNKINQKVVASYLKKRGHEPDLVDNGLEAVAAVERGDYDVVLMDVQMPELDGLQAARRIRALVPGLCDVPIIALTANAMKGAEEECRAAGMDDYVSKPIDPEILLSKLAALAQALEAEAPAAAPAGPAAPEETPRSDEASAIDLSSLEALEAVMTPDEIEALLEGYLTENAKRLAKIHELAREGEHAAAAREAHAMISTSGSVGAMRLSELARDYEHACLRDDADAIGRIEPALVDASRAAGAGLRRWLASHAVAS